MNDSDVDGVCDELEISGCTSQSACNFDSSATDDDGSCFSAEPFTNCDGVCDEGYINFGDGCELIVPGCTDTCI